MSIPRAPLTLGLAGLIPFLVGAYLSVFVQSDASDADAYPLFAPGDGQIILTAYGVVILCFMSGVLWGFATRAEERRAVVFYVWAVVPALWVFFTATAHVFDAPGLGSIGANLIAGFLGLLALDWHFWKNELTPVWWMQLRGLLTAIVTLCLIPLVL